MDLLYWKNNLLANIIDSYKCNGKYIIFEPWNGGFNNIRMSFELASTIAFRMNRILVMPNPYRITHLLNINDFDTFFDISEIGIKTINIDDFCNIHNINNSWDDIKSISMVYNFLPDTSYINLTTECNISNKYTKNRQVINIDNTSDNIYFERNLLGTFYTLIYDNHMFELVKYVKRHIHFKEYLFIQAKIITEYLDTLYTNYYALHIRRTDFNIAYKEVCISTSDIYNNIHELIPSGSCIYISSDSTNKDEFNIFREKYRVVLFQDVVHLLNIDINPDLYGLIEQIICARGVKFIGTNLSTFSCYIYRLRGYMNDISDKTYYIHTNNYTYKKENNNRVNNKVQLGWKYNWTSNDNIWTREFIDGFELNVLE
jgi:hypothetical protein